MDPCRSDRRPRRNTQLLHGSADVRPEHEPPYPHREPVQEFMMCVDGADAADPAKAAAVCQGNVKKHVSDPASSCGLASACTCTLKTADATSLSAVCMQECPALVAP